MAKSDDSFVARFEHVMEGFDQRIRALETGRAASQQEMKDLRSDRLDKHDKAIQELYDSRNEVEKTLERLKNSALSLNNFSESLEATVTKLREQSILLGEGEKTRVAQLEAIAKLDAPARLQKLESSVETLEQGKATKIKDNRWLLMLVVGAAVGATATIVNKLVIWYFTKAG